MKKKINIIVPIARLDKKFLAKFNNFKYFTEINNKPLIQFTIGSFKKLSKLFSLNFIFILNKTDNSNYKITNHLKKKIKFKFKYIILNKITSSVIQTCLKADMLVKDNEDVIIFHPDSYSNYNEKSLYNLINSKISTGIIFGYSGFNPVDFNSNNTGRFIIDKNSNVKKVYEKEYYSKNFFTTTGIYYFKSWSTFKKHANLILKSKKNKHKLTAEVFNSIIEHKQKVKFFKVDNFINFSNIESINEYNFWRLYYNREKNLKRKKIKINCIVPAAGSGKRHSVEYSSAKPLINISGKSMIYRASTSLPPSSNYYFILRKKIVHKYRSKINDLKKKFKKIKIISIVKKTKGMAITCLKVKEILDKTLPLLISSCDYSFLYNHQKFLNLLKSKKPDAIIFTFRKYPDARIDPNSYAYVKVKNQLVSSISEKKTISSTPHKDFAVTGIFYFKNWYKFEYAVKRMIKSKKSINGEYYVATAIQELIDSNMKVYNFEIDKFISWSLPSHLKTYYYWEEIYKRFKNVLFKRNKRN